MSEKKVVQVTEDGRVIIPHEFTELLGGSIFDIHIDEEGRLILRPITLH